MRPLWSGEDVVEHAAPHKRAEVEVVLVDDKRNSSVADVSVKDVALKDLPRSKPKRQRKARTTRTEIKSSAPKVKMRGTVPYHPYLRRGEYGRRRR